MKCLARLIRMRTILGLLLLACCWLVPESATCQQPSTQAAGVIAYDAVTIKPDRSGAGSVRISVRDASFQASNVSLKQLMVQAYGLRENLISGLPGWAESDRYDVNAKVVETDPKLLNGLPIEQRRAMLTAVLMDRFGLKVHTEIKELPVYDLMVKDGSRLKQSAPPTPTPTPTPTPGRDAPPHTGAGRGDFNSRGNGSSIEVTAKAVPLSRLAEYLTQCTDRTVVEKTGLAGEYDLHLLFALDNAPLLNGAPDPALPPVLFTAIQEQLGLRLVSSRGPVVTLVVDHVAPPSEN